MNIREIAKLTGVSVASVSRTLNPALRDKVSPKLRKRILDKCEKMRYSPNTHTVKMLSKRSNTIAILMPETSIFQKESSIKGGGMDDALSASIAGAESEASHNSLHILLLSATKNFIKSKEYLKLYRSKMVDGLLIWGWSNSDLYLKDIIEENIPCVMMQTTGNNLSVSSVVPQNHEGMIEIVNYIINKGHKKIGIVSPTLTASAGRERHLGVVKAFKQNNMEPSWVSSGAGFTGDDGYKATLEIMKNAPDTTAIIASNDLAALGAIKAAKELGLKVPEQLSITGADGLDLHGLLDLTTFISPSHEIGKESLKLLINLIEGEELGTPQKRLPVQFIPGTTVSTKNP